jgi:hypothetical protein
MENGVSLLGAIAVVVLISSSGCSKLQQEPSYIQGIRQDFARNEVQGCKNQVSIDSIAVTLLGIVDDTTRVYEASVNCFTDRSIILCRQYWVNTKTLEFSHGIE